MWYLSQVTSGIAGRHRDDPFVPVGHRDRDAVRLGGRRKVLLGSALSELEGESQHAVDADACHHGLLNHHLARRIGEDAAADRRIFAFGVFAYDIEVDVARLAVRQRRGNAGHEPDGAEVDVLVELAPELQQRSPQRDVVGDLLGPADRAEEDRIMRPDLLLPVVRQHLSVPGVIVERREIERVEAQVEAVLPGHSLQDRAAFRHDFLADPVARNDGNSVMIPSSSVGHAFSRSCPVERGFTLVASGERTTRAASSKTAHTAAVSWSPRPCARAA